MSAIVHQTPGLIDIRAFTTMGMSAKVSTNPLGQFGTGLKYAIAVLVRAGARPVVWIGRDRYEFFQESTDFRGKEFQLVRMKRKKWSLTKPSTHDLPFTTEYGKNWKMWMAFRELEANTRDEEGHTYIEESPTFLGDSLKNGGLEGHTTIVIEHPEYVEAWEKRDEVFLPGGLAVREGSEGLQIIREPSQRVYYRGMRAYDLDKPTLFTYNVLAPIDLTEDRTLKYEFQIKEQLARHILGSADADLIEQIVTTDDDYWENNLDFPQWAQPGATFRQVAEARPKGMWSSVGGYYHRHDKRPVERPQDLLDAHPRPWKVADNVVVDKNGKPVFDAPYGYKGRWEPLAQLLIDRLDFSAKLEDEADPDPPEPETPPALEAVTEEVPF
jgi:hypothetical protein